MKVLLYADFRSSHSRGWHQGLRAAGVDVIAVSSEVVADYDATSPSDPVSRRRELFVKARAATVSTNPPEERKSSSKPLIRNLISRAIDSQTFHSFVHLIRARYLRARLEKIVQAEKPDLIHALRIPYEGVTAASIRSHYPIIISTWGSDLVPQASSDPILGRWARGVLRRVDGFQYDSSQDLARAVQSGLREGVPTLHAAGNFGVENELFFVDKNRTRGVVVYPRRAKPNANYRGFVEAAIQLSQTFDARFVGVGLESAKDELEAEFGLSALSAVELTGQLDRAEMAALLRSAEVVVSPTFWDGTPISVLEAIACGAKVIAGRLPELVLLKERGMDVDLIDASTTQSIAAAIKRALDTEGFGDASSLPVEFDRRANESRIIDFYSQIVNRSKD